ncbi:hypothetical protein AGMMS4956_07420 [Bacteroidia bacterium]|nr:hypothetical protein AGMMS4956_07420 [Bacteroidia bacterium]
MEAHKEISLLRLASHQLAGTALPTPQKVVSWMGAIQAQDYNMAKWAMGIRLEKFTDKMVEAAFNKGQFLRTHVLRPTWHFVSPANIRWMLQLSAERIKASSRARDRDLEITEPLYTQSNNVIEKSLADQHLTRSELVTALEKSGIQVDASRMVHFMMRAEVEGIVCSGALQGKNQTYALLDQRAPLTKPLHRDEALAQLAHIYFGSHCPATLQDFIWWSGLSVAEAKQGLEAIKSTLVAADTEGQTYWLNPATERIVPAAHSAHLLPAFDEYLVAYRNRQAALHARNHSKAISSNGVFRPVVLVDGQVIGLWKKTTSKNNPIAFDFFDAPNAAVRKRIQEAADKFCEFIAFCVSK